MAGPVCKMCYEIMKAVLLVFTHDAHPSSTPGRVKRIIEVSKGLERECVVHACVCVCACTWGWGEDLISTWDEKEDVFPK